MPKKSGNSERSGGSLALFALPFAGVGIFMLAMTTRILVESWQIRMWAEVPATILEARLESRQDDGSTVYKVIARYRYEYEGNSYNGDRVGLHSGSDNVGSYHERKQALLAKHMESGQPIRCRVNPKAPEESILFPEPRFEMLIFYMIFALVFGGCGMGMFFWGIRSWLKSRRLGAQKEEFAEQPWMWRKEWADGKICSSGKAGAVGMTVFAIVWNVISVPAAIMAFREIEKGNIGAGFVFIFPMIGVCLILGAVYFILRRIKYGQSVFEFSSVPGVLGGKLEGIIRTSRKVRPDGGFRLELACVRRETSGTGKNRSTRETSVWQSVQSVRTDLLERNPERTAIPVDFTIPYDLQETSVSTSDPSIRWRLKVDAATDGIDYAEHFEVPVFRTPDSRKDLVQSTIATSQEPMDAASLATELRRYGAILQRHGAGVNIHFPMGRNMKMGCGLTLGFVICTGICIGLFIGGAPIPLTIVFSLLDLLLFFLAMHTWLHSSRILVRNGLVEYAGGWLGLGPTHRFRGGSIQTFQAEKRAETNGIVYYRLVMQTQDGKKHTLASNIPNRELLERLGATIREMATQGID